MIKVYKKIKGLESSWKNLIDSDEGPIYLTYEFHELFYRDYRYRKFLLRSFRYKEAIYVCNVIEGEIVTIAPLLINHKEKSIDFIGVMGGAGYNDFIYSKKTELKFLMEILAYLKEKYAGYELCLTDLLFESGLSMLTNTEFFRSCYSISIDDGFENWFCSLSRNTKGTIRQSYNRVKNDNVKMKFHFTNKISFGNMLRIFSIYQKRLLENQARDAGEFHINLKSKFRAVVGFIPKLLCVPFFSGFNKIDRSRIGYLTINGEIVAFTLGYVEGNGIICPRCGFDSRYARCRPGLINNIEIIKSQTQNGKPFIFDLSRDYHEYKVRMGGVEYDNLRICMKL